LLRTSARDKEVLVNESLSATATDWRRGRRLRAWELHEQGWSKSQIAAALGVTSGAVIRWMRRIRERSGPGALRKRRAPGGQPRLSAEQEVQILEWLREGAEAHGFRGELWTKTRLAVLIERKLGIRYHPGHVSKLLKSWRWSSQKPERRARQRNEEAIRSAEVISLPEASAATHSRKAADRLGRRTDPPQQGNPAGGICPSLDHPPDVVVEMG
jgi:transposase